MKIRHRYKPFEERFLRFSSHLEKILKKIAIFLFILLLVTQFLLTFDMVRKSMVPVEKVEGTVAFR